MNTKRIGLFLLGICLPGVFEGAISAQAAGGGNHLSIGGSPCSGQIFNSPGARIVIENCYLNSTPPPRPPGPVNPVDRESVIDHGLWWVEFYSSDRFGGRGGFKEARMLSGQVADSNRISQEWAGADRPYPFPRGRGVSFQATISGERYFEEGTYCFRIDAARSRDSHRIYLGGTEVLEHWYPNGGTSRGIPESCYVLEAGTYPIDVEYFHSANDANIGVSWRKVNQISSTQ